MNRYRASYKSPARNAVLITDFGCDDNTDATLFAEEIYPNLLLMSLYNMTEDEWVIEDTNV